MLLNRWWRRSRQTTAQRRSFRPRLEVLEARTLLSNYSAANVGDLVADINASNTSGGSNQITLTAPTSSPYALANGTLTIAKNDHLTILGNGDTIERSSTALLPFGLLAVAKGASLTLDELTLSNGEAVDPLFGGIAGGAIFNLGSLTLSDATLTNNSALKGGAIYSAGTLNLSNVTVSNNSVAAGTGGSGNNGRHGTFSSVSGGNGGNGGNGGDAFGGGLYVASGTATLRSVTVSDNTAQGGQGGTGGHGGNGFSTYLGIGGNGGLGGTGGVGGAAEGGGLYLAGGAVTLVNDVFSGNSAQGGQGGTGGTGGHGGTDFNGGNGSPGGQGGIGGTGGEAGAAEGGGLFVGSGTLTLAQDVFSSNTVKGGQGGTGGIGGLDGASAAGAYNGQPTFIPGGGGGNGGNASGAGMYVAAGSINLSDATLSGNTAQGGNGGGLGLGAGSGYISTAAYKMGINGNGGSASGGGLFALAGSLNLSNATLSGNTVQGGNGGLFVGASQSVTLPCGTGGNGGDALGGNLYAWASSLTLHSDTLAYGTAQAGSGEPGINGNGSNGTASAGGLGIFSGTIITPGAVVQLANTLIADNTAPSDPDVSGTVVSSDHDLIGNSSGYSAQSSTGDILNPPNIYLGQLADNGGSVAGATGSQQTLQTVALTPNSSTITNPPIDTGDDNVIPAATDERGYARITGGGIDIGAYESGASAATGNLAVSIKAPYDAAAGGDIIYTLTVHNYSATAQQNVFVTDPLPANATLVSWTTPAGWIISGPSAGSGSGSSVSAWTSSMRANSSAVFTLTVQVNSTAAAGTVITDTASVGPTTGDVNLLNNHASAKTTIAVPVDVSANGTVDVNVGWVWNTKVNEWEETLVIYANSAVSGPLAVMLTGLSSSATLVGAEGMFQGNPYLEIAAARYGLKAGQSVSLSLYVKSPQSLNPNYGTEVWQGL